MENQLVKINDRISYLPASFNPLSCDVVFIKSKDCTWIYDVGCCKTACDLINSIPGKKNIVISHFHYDHVKNLDKVNYDNLFVSNFTFKHVNKGTIVEENLVFEEDGISIFMLPSSHAKGCLALVCGDYAFTGDGTYCKEKLGNHRYNVQLLKAEIDVLEKLPVQFVCLDHDKNFVQKKDTLVRLHKAIFNRRKEGESEISVEDFFDAFGNVIK